jgi:site-specific DNA recombinase
MFDQPSPENALAAIRASSARQGFDGDSPEAQKEQIESFAISHNMAIKETMILLESASKDIQPMQVVVDYCKNPKNNIQVVIIKSIDRFTRGGATPYDLLKTQLEKYGVKLIDIYGVISSKKVNTLEHLGIKYRWSEYSPSQKTEILEAERAKDELRDIMSRMIGAQVRYSRLGYWMREPPYGLQNQATETGNGKRRILVPHPIEADFIRKMFELRCRGNMHDTQIVDEINKLGYTSRITNRRSTIDKTQIIARAGGKKLTLKRFWLYIQNPIYAGVMCEKWTENKPVKCPFESLVSRETFNKANRGKIIISEQDSVIKLLERPIPEYWLRKGSHNADYPYRKIITCPTCSEPLYGSAARGRSGKYYPAYHCNKRGHYFRVPKEEFENTIADFTHKIAFSEDHIADLISAVETVWNRRQQELNKEEVSIDNRISILRAQADAALDKIKLLSSETVIKYMEEDLMKIESEIATLENEKDLKKVETPTNIEVVMQYVKYFLEHLDYLLFKQIDPVKRANFFGVIFDKTPTYQEIFSGTKDIGQITGINELFKLEKTNKSLMVRVRGL